MSRFDSSASRLVGFVLAAMLLHAATGLAQPEGAQVERAKALFREGNALLAAGNAKLALERFMESRRAVASGKNTANAAICLERLGHLDEALELYEELLERFVADLDSQDRESLMPTISRLRAQLGNLEIEPSFEGEVSIDGRTRPPAPRANGWWVSPGKRRVRLLKTGFEPFERVVEIKVGKTLVLDPELEPSKRRGAAGSERATKRTAVPRAPDRGATTDRTAWALPTTIGGGALLAAGTATVVVATVALDDERQSLKANCVTLRDDTCVNTTADRHDAAQSDALDITQLKAARIAGYSAAGVGLAALAVGIYGLVGTGKDAEQQPRTFVRPADGYVGLVIQSRF